jgi:hypothetical protein
MDHVWLRQELEKPGRSQSALARYLGFEHASIVNRMVTDGPKRRQIKATEADKIHSYLTETNRDGAATSHTISPLTEASLLKVRGAVESGSWKELAYAEMVIEELPAPKSIIDTGAFAFKVVGPGFDQDYPDGSYVVVQPWHGGPLPFGKHVVVERERGGLVERTIKEMVRRADNVIELWPRSSHPDLQAPLMYGDQDGTMVRLVGRVIWKISPVT